MSNPTETTENFEKLDNFLTERRKNFEDDITKIIGKNTLDYKVLAEKYPLLPELIDLTLENFWDIPFIGLVDEKIKFEWRFSKTQESENSFSFASYEATKLAKVEIFLNENSDTARIRYIKKNWEKLKTVDYKPDNLSKLIQWLDDPIDNFEIIPD